jgi:predicted SAM-dependent methyltransferase
MAQAFLPSLLNGFPQRHLRWARRRLGNGQQPASAQAVDFSRYDKINYGCGYDKLAGYLNVDIDPMCQPDLLIAPGDLSAIPKGHFSEVHAKDVLEHIPRAHSLDALVEFASLLRPGGRLMVQTSSITDLAHKFLADPPFQEQYGWTICQFGNQTHPGDYHFTGFTDRTLTVHLVAAGFEVVHKDLIDGWMFRWECRKTQAWDELLAASLGNEAFLSAAYEQLLGRPADAQARAHLAVALRGGADRRAVLKGVAASPERLLHTARRLGL